MGVVFKDVAVSSLASGVTDAGLSITVASGEGTRFPDTSSGDEFYVTIQDADDKHAFEIVRVTSRSVDTFTIERAQQETNAAAWSAGSLVELRLTAELFQKVWNSVDHLPLASLGFLPVNPVLPSDLSIVSDSIAFGNIDLNGYTLTCNATLRVA
nr:hypothetical protein [Desulfovibrionales bacterium]